MKKLFLALLLLAVALPSEANGPELVKKADVIQVIRECFQTFAEVDTAILFTAIEDEVKIVNQGGDIQRIDFTKMTAELQADGTFIYHATEQIVSIPVDWLKCAVFEQDDNSWFITFAEKQGGYRVRENPLELLKKFEPSDSAERR